MKRPFPTSTTDRYIPGVGITITQANIAAEQQRRAKEGQSPATAKDIYDAFVATATEKKNGLQPCQRRMGRIHRLMK